jgi:GxxExxY protein
MAMEDEPIESRDSEAVLTAERTYATIGAAMEVHRRLGHGFAEPVYQHALAAEFDHCGIPYISECELPVFYRDSRLPVAYRADFVCYSNIIVELKALEQVGDAARSQVMNYLKATGLARGLLLNFGTPKLEYKRILWAPNLLKSVSSVDQKDGTYGTAG